MFKVSLLSLFLCVSCVVGQTRNPTPSMDLINVPGNYPPYIPIKIGYPAQGPFNMALYLNYDMSWIYGRNETFKERYRVELTKKKKKGNGRKNGKSNGKTVDRYCFDERRSSTFYSMSEESITTSTQLAADVLRVNNDEYAFQFGFIKNRCDKRSNNFSYSGIIGLAPTKEHENSDLLSLLKQVDQPVVSFFLPSRFSQQRKGGIVFGAKTHPACFYNEYAHKFATSLSSTQWIFNVYCCNYFDLNGGRTRLHEFNDLQNYNATFNMEVEDIYGPANQVFNVYKMLGAKRLSEAGEEYYVECDKVQNRSLAFDLRNEAFVSAYQLEGRHLVTPHVHDKSKCIVNIKTGGPSATQWVFGKKFVERFCITLDFKQNQVSLGTVYDVSKFDGNK